MRGTLCIGAFRNTATVITTALFLSGCLIQDKIEDEDLVADVALEDEFELSGSVGDGPVVGAAMRVISNDGSILNEFESDASAGYNIVVKTKGKYYPLTVDARGGIDIVTNLAPDFVLLGAALVPSKKYVVNVNPYSTLAMEIATDLPGGRSTSNIYTAQDIAVASMNNGLASLVSNGPMTTKINSSNVAEIVKTSEALGEIVRRTRDWLLTAGFIWDGDAVIGAMGSDLIDSVIDGAGGPRSDARMAAIASIVTAQVLLESMSNELYVNGTDATASLESAIQMMNLGTASPALGELNATSGMLAQINVGLAAADAISNDARVSSLRQSVAGFQPGMQPTLARSVLTPDYRQLLDGVVQLLIGGDAITIATVNDVVRNGGDLPDNNFAPQINGTPGVAVEAGSMYQFLPSASDADGDPLTFSVSNKPTWTTFEAANGLMSGIPAESDVGLYSGIVVSVSDGKITTSLPAFTISVSSSFGNTAPTINGSPPATATQGIPYSFTPTASDADQDPLTYSISGRPPWTTFDSSSGTLSGIPTSANVGVHSGIVISVSDGSAVSRLPAFSITVQGVVSNSPPSISGTPPAVVTANTLYEFTPTASDADNNPLTFSISGRPLWTTFDSSSGTLSGTPTSADVGVHGGIVISVSDGSATSSLLAFSINVVADSPACTDCVDFAAVTTSSFANQDFDSNFTIFDGGASIQLDNNTWRQTDTTYTITPNTVVEFTFESSVQGEMHAIGFDQDNVLSEDRIFRVYGTQQDFGISDFDTYTGSGQQTFTIPVGQYFTGSGFHLIIANDDDAGIGANGTFSDIRVYEDVPTPVPPVINNPGTQSNGINASVLLTVTATDANGDTLTFSATGLPNGLGIAADGTISGMPTMLGTWSATVTVDDGNGGTDSATFTWTVNANSPPQISGTPSPSVNVGQGYSFTSTASDPDGDNLTFNIQNMPPWAQFDTATGALSGTPQAGDAGSYANISISVSDGNLSDTLPNFATTVNQVSLGSATLNWIPPTQNTDSTALTDLAGYNIYWGAPGNYSNSMTLNNSGLATYVVENLAPGTYEFVVTAFNAAGMESQYSNSATKTIP